MKRLSAHPVPNHPNRLSLHKRHSPAGPKLPLLLPLYLHILAGGLRSGPSCSIATLSAWLGKRSGSEKTCTRRFDLHSVRRPLFRTHFFCPTTNLPPGTSTGLLAFSGHPHRTPVGAHPYQRPPSPAGKGKGTDKGKARAKTSPTLMWLVKAKRAKKVHLGSASSTHSWHAAGLILGPSDLQGVTVLLIACIPRRDGGSATG